MSFNLKNVLIGFGAVGALALGANAMTDNEKVGERARHTSVAESDEDYSTARLQLSTGEPDRDCGDFSTQAEAQDFMDSEGPGDPHGLDRDSDGEACETLP